MMTTNPTMIPAPSKLAAVNEQTWIQVGSLSETLSETDRAIHAYESALRHNPYSSSALLRLAGLFKLKERYSQAADCYQRLLNIESQNGEYWSSLAHCYLCMEELQKAYSAFQQALYYLPNPKDPNVWFGIGLLYDRYGSEEHAEEAFLSALSMDGANEHASMIYYRLGCIYCKRKKYDASLECLRYILSRPLPKALHIHDVYYQIGLVYERKGEVSLARDIYEQILKENGSHLKSLQQLGWLLFQHSPFKSPETATATLLKAVELDAKDAFSWYLLGRCYVSQKLFTKAYEAFQQAVYRDGRHPAFWCSIGILYFQIHQYRDALDAYIRAIHLNPYMGEVWWNLGVLYESCNNQVNDALDAYQRALELDQNNTQVKLRMTALKQSQSQTQSQQGGANGSSNSNHNSSNGSPSSSPLASSLASLPPPLPLDISPFAYASTASPLGGTPGAPGSGSGSGPGAGGNNNMGEGGNHHLAAPSMPLQLSGGPQSLTSSSYGGGGGSSSSSQQPRGGMSMMYSNSSGGNPGRHPSNSSAGPMSGYDLRGGASSYSMMGRKSISPDVKPLMAAGAASSDHHGAAAYGGGPLYGGSGGSSHLKPGTSQPHLRSISPADASLRSPSQFEEKKSSMGLSPSASTHSSSGSMSHMKRSSSQLSTDSSPRS